MGGGEASPGQQKEPRHPDQVNGRGVVTGQLGEHQPFPGRPLHPGADVGDKGAGDPDPIVDPSRGPKDTAGSGVRA
jgi:hypothetical protein